MATISFPRIESLPRYDGPSAELLGSFKTWCEDNFGALADRNVSKGCGSHWFLIDVDLKIY